MSIDDNCLGSSSVLSVAAPSTIFVFNFNCSYNINIQIINNENNYYILLLVAEFNISVEADEARLLS